MKTLDEHRCPALHLRLLLLLIVSLGVAVAADAEALAEALRTGGDRPPDATFELRLTAPKKVFQPGEPIDAEMVIQEASPEAYGVSTRTSRDRDLLVADPAPRSGSIAELLGVQECKVRRPKREELPSGESSTVIPFDLRSCLYLTGPGAYEVRMVTRRVFRRTNDGSGRRDWLTMVAPAVRVVVEAPDPGWERRQTAVLQEVIGGAHSGQWPRIDTTRAEDWLRRVDGYSAPLLLAYLREPEATRAIARLLGRPDPGMAERALAALEAAPAPGRFVPLLDVAIEAPEEGVTRQLIDALAMTRAAQKLRQEGVGSPEQARERFAKLSADTGVIYESLVEALPSKIGLARATSLRTLLERVSPLTAGAQVDESLDWEAFRPALAGVFGELPARTQLEMLNKHWELVRHPGLRPILMQLLDPEQAPQDAHLVRGKALERLSEIAPAEARRFVVEEAGRERPLVADGFLLHLPDDALPELEPTILKQLRASRQPVARTRPLALLERYGSESIYREVRAVEATWPTLGDERSACDESETLLAYYLRVDPEYGLERVAAALEPGGFDEDRCRNDLLGRVFLLEPNYRLEELGVGLLYDPSPRIVASVAVWLASLDPSRHESELWKRLEAFHEEWAGRRDELDALDGSRGVFDNPTLVRRGLVRALSDMGLGPAAEKRMRRLALVD